MTRAESKIEALKLAVALRNSVIAAPEEVLETAKLFASWILDDPYSAVQREAQNFTSGRIFKANKAPDTLGPSVDSHEDREARIRAAVEFKVLNDPDNRATRYSDG